MVELEKGDISKKVITDKKVLDMIKSINESTAKYGYWSKPKGCNHTDKICTYYQGGLIGSKCDRCK